MSTSEEGRFRHPAQECACEHPEPIIVMGETVRCRNCGQVVSVDILEPMLRDLALEALILRCQSPMLPRIVIPRGVDRESDLRGEIEYAWLPKHIREGAQRWIEEGVPPGSFLRAVIENDLRISALNADSVCAAELARVAYFWRREAPRECSGSRERARAWAEKHGENWPRRPQQP